MERRLSETPSSAAAEPERTPLNGPEARVTAVVVTHKRPHLAGDLVRSLINVERLPPDRIVVIVNEEGGLDDPALEGSVHMIRLDKNVGPAGGFKVGLEAAFENSETQWAYLCEDDVGLLPLPSPRLSKLVDRVEALGDVEPPLGAVVSYGRVFDRTGHAPNFVPDLGSPQELHPVDVAAWGATLISRSVALRPILPELEWFFGYEDFDFFCRVREAGYSVMVDAVAARGVAGFETNSGRGELHSGKRPTDSDESWRAYYVARNFFSLARRHGTPRWIVWHFLYSARRFQLASSGAERRAILHGLWDGALGRLGEHPRYQRSIGELSANAD